MEKYIGPTVEQEQYDTIIDLGHPRRTVSQRLLRQYLSAVAHAAGVLQPDTTPASFAHQDTTVSQRLPVGGDIDPDIRNIFAVNSPYNHALFEPNQQRQAQIASEPGLTSIGIIPVDNHEFVFSPQSLLFLLQSVKAHFLKAVVPFRLYEILSEQLAPNERTQKTRQFLDEIFVDQDDINEKRAWEKVVNDPFLLLDFNVEQLLNELLSGAPRLLNQNICIQIISPPEYGVEAGQLPLTIHVLLSQLLHESEQVNVIPQGMGEVRTESFTPAIHVYSESKPSGLDRRWQEIIGRANSARNDNGTGQFFLEQINNFRQHAQRISYFSSAIDIEYLKGRYGLVIVLNVDEIKTLKRFGNRFLDQETPQQYLTPISALQQSLYNIEGTASSTIEEIVAPGGLLLECNMPIFRRERAVQTGQMEINTHFKSRF
ncbi:hypothetical protein KC726_04300 [Candidatus Woesebacteria bacterium]|nr:hypothetical protein [Candidatus Woesebacteria bacterium]